ncbi:MAG: hypothetical protein R3A47_01055 [Polyangiales bacterium]
MPTASDSGAVHTSGANTSHEGSQNDPSETQSGDPEIPTVDGNSSDTIEVGAPTDATATSEEQNADDRWAGRSSHEREEMAKDEIAIARDALDDGDFARARAALRNARSLDPDNSDVQQLLERIESAENAAPN